MKIAIRLLLMILMVVVPVEAATSWFVDNAASGANNGTSWANAWTTLTTANAGTTPASGDTVFISGGNAGTTNTLNITASFVPKSGVTYKIGQDAGHTGYVKFNKTTAGLIDAFDGGGKSSVLITGLLDVDPSTDIIGVDASKCHFIRGNNIGEMVYFGNSTSCRAQYINCGSDLHGIHVSDSTGYELDHIWMFKTDEGAGGQNDAAIFSISVNGATYDVNKVHHCTIDVIRSGCGDGDDGIQGMGNGVSVYNNILKTHSGTYTGQQHGDGLQPTSGQFLKVYNNYFSDWPNYAIFFDAFFGTISHTRIYNNVAEITSASLQTCDAIRGFVIVPDGGAPNFTFDDNLVFNNVVANMAAHGSIEMGNQNGTQSSVFTHSAVQNNVVINSNGLDLDGAVTNNHNVSFTSATAGAHFVSYANPGVNNYRIINSSEASLKDAGFDITSFFTTDQDGNTRPSGSAVDIGPFEFVSGVAVPGTLALTSSAQTVSENVGSVQFTVSRSGGSSGTVGISYTTGNGTATAPGDYTTTSGTLSWANGDTANKTITIPIIDDSTVESTESFSLILSSPTGGATLGSPSTATITITDNDTLPPTLSVSPSTAQTFTDTDVNQSRTLTFTVSNTGGGTLNGSVTGLSAPFSVVSGSPYSIGGGGNQVVTIRFSPTTVGTFSQTAAFSSSGAGASRGLTGTGLAVNSTILSGVAAAGPVSFNQ